ncbi:DUF4199 domain-containing protein [Dyella sp.]|jgi:hypothetical protein|uniref:DUF4199 domain-containing protein n=1 Tax=Dyella sp. TaxID=1869338 RepID=UPI002D76FA98|nr:DUF4199 domain-containing protein [Dyella sp.]HET6432677.1 DUF4199 domain-containing protein [Dyella sp.]
MLRDILKFGVIAGLVLAAGMWITLLAFHGAMSHGAMGMLLGYLTMLVALSAVFVGIKSHRDMARGGVIRFWPAFGMGLAISLVASLFYVVAWEIAQATVVHDFAAQYASSVIAHATAKGADTAEVARLTARMEAFKAQYANPLYRVPMTFAEIFPVGVLVSLVSAAILRNPRVLSARTRA